MGPVPLRSRPAVLSLVVVSFLLVAGCAGQTGGIPGKLRLGYFANMTHAQALYGVDSGLFQKALGDTKLETKVVAAGPAAFEALLAGQLDVIYVGPSPTISAIDVAGTGVIRVIAGSASGGASFVVQPELKGVPAASLAGKKLATPQLGNTQDVSLKAWMGKNGLKARENGGNVDIINAAPADALLLFQQKKIDGAWMPEPWATRLVQEGSGVVYLDEASLWPDGKFVTTQIVTTKAFLNGHAADVKKLLDAHVQATLHLQQAGDAGALEVNAAILNATGKGLKEATILEAARHVTFTYDPLASSFVEDARAAKDLGFLKHDVPKPADVYDFKMLNEVLTARSLAEVNV